MGKIEPEVSGFKSLFFWGGGGRAPESLTAINTCLDEMEEFKAAVDTLTMNIFIRQNIGRGTTFKILKSRAVQSRFRQNLADVLENDQSAL